MLSQELNTDFNNVKYKTYYLLSYVCLVMTPEGRYYIIVSSSAHPSFCPSVR